MADQRLSLAPGALAKAKDAIEILSSLASSVSEQSSTHPGGRFCPHYSASDAGPSGLNFHLKGMTKVIESVFTMTIILVSKQK